MKYHNYILLVLISSICACLHAMAPDEAAARAHSIAQSLFHYVAHNDQEQAQLLEPLLRDLFVLTPEENCILAQQVLELLTKELNQLERTTIRIDKNNQRVPLLLFYKKFLLNHQIDHCARITGKSRVFSWQQQFGNWYNRAHAWFSGKTSLSTLAREVVNFVFHEIDILLDKDVSAAYLHALKNNPLPPLLYNWNDPEVQKDILMRARRLDLKARVQMSMAADFLLQSLIMSGGNMAVTFAQEAQQQQMKNITDQIQKLSQSWDEFRKNELSQRVTAIQNLSNSFGAALKTIQDTSAASIQRFQQETAYFSRLLGFVQPRTNFIAGGLTPNWDIFFAASLMRTPQSLGPWYNMFTIWQWLPADSGDWRYDGNRNSFWQYSKMAIDASSLIKAKSSSEPNAIFTDYITDQTSYDIEAEMTLVDVSYPFFAGIRFNAGRIVPGVIERSSWYRFLGLYGSQKDPKDSKTASIQLCFSQQQLTVQQDGSSTIVTPLEQILSNKAPNSTPLTTVVGGKETLVKTIATNPITFIFKITTQRNSVTYSVLQKPLSGDTTPQVIASATINDLPTYIYQFNGIGFSAAGCIAEFKLNKPEALLFTPDAQAAFKKALENDIAKITKITGAQ